MWTRPPAHPKPPQTATTYTLSARAHTSPQLGDWVGAASLRHQTQRAAYLALHVCRVHIAACRPRFRGLQDTRHRGPQRADEVVHQPEAPVAAVSVTVSPARSHQLFAAASRAASRAAHLEGKREPPLVGVGGERRHRWASPGAHTYDSPCAGSTPERGPNAESGGVRDSAAVAVRAHRWLATDMLMASRFGSLSCGGADPRPPLPPLPPSLPPPRPLPPPSLPPLPPRPPFSRSLPPPPVAMPPLRLEPRPPPPMRNPLAV